MLIMSLIYPPLVSSATRPFKYKLLGVDKSISGINDLGKLDSYKRKKICMLMIFNEHGSYKIWGMQIKKLYTILSR